MNKLFKNKGWKNIIAIWCISIIFLVILSFLILSWFVHPARTEAQRAVILESACHWLQPNVRTQLFIEASNLISMKTPAMRANAADISTFERRQFPTLFGQGLVCSSNHMILSPRTVYVTSFNGQKWVEARFPLKMSILSSYKLGLIIQPDGRLYDGYKYVVRFSDGDKQQIGIVMGERL